MLIGLPLSLLYSTGNSRACTLLFERCNQFNDMLLVNAAEDVEDGNRPNRSLSGHLEKIIQACRERIERSRHCYRVEIAEFAHNGFSLNISLCVIAAVGQEEFERKAVRADLVKIEKEIVEAKNRHNEFLKELGLPLLH